MGDNSCCCNTAHMDIKAVSIALPSGATPLLDKGQRMLSARPNAVKQAAACPHK